MAKPKALRVVACAWFLTIVLIATFNTQIEIPANVSHIIHHIDLFILGSLIIGRASSIPTTPYNATVQKKIITIFAEVVLQELFGSLLMWLWKVALNHL